MSNNSVTPQLQFEIEQFYYREARLLDARQYQTWLTLMSESIRYIMPSRVNTQVNNRKRGQESMIAVERELERVDSDGCPIREENFIYLSVRVERAYKINSWSENPPARTRRIVGNIEIMEQTQDSLTVWSNFHLFYARPGAEDTLFAGQRRDVLGKEGNAYKVQDREIILDYANINWPTLGLFF